MENEVIAQGKQDNIVDDIKEDTVKTAIQRSSELQNLINQ